jgi:tetratricopeptide (TPR) repeat protein
MKQASAPEQTILDDLVSQWQRRRAEGQSVTLRELCRERPELLPQLEQRITSLLDAGHASATIDSPAAPQVAAEASNGTPWMATLDFDGSQEMPTFDFDGSGQSAAPARWPRIPGYEIVGELGRGGMGVVYKARQIQLNRMVALKMILAGSMAAKSQLARFRTEAEAIARVQHANIVQIHEVGEHDGLPFFSLEFCSGGSLERKIKGTPLPAEEAARLVRTLAQAMQVAHQAQVIHRDLKPANVLLTADGTAKITDFGLAKKLDVEGQTHTGAVMGTPSYMAPEQAGGHRDIGPAADVYALGAILYELLTGRPPFKGPTALDTIMQVVQDEPVPPRRLQSKLPHDLETVCLKCLQKDFRKRYASAQALADDLQRWSDGRPILARPVSPGERAWKWARRRPALAGLAAVGLAAILAATSSGVLYGLYESQRAAERERETQASREVQEQYIQGQQAEAGSQFDQAKEHYVRALTTLQAEPSAAGADVQQALEDRINRVSGRLREQGLLAERHVLADRLRRFRDHYDEVRFRAVRFRDQEAADDAAAVRKEATAALKELGIDARSPQLLKQGLGPLLQLAETTEQRQRLAEECVEVLLAWADAEAAVPTPGGPTEALRLLEDAAVLGRTFVLPASRALHLRRAKYLQARDDASGADAEEKRAAGITPTTALDLFDEALTSYRANRITESSVACARVLRLRSDHFWAQYIQALCYLRQQRWGEAEVALNVCLGQRPKFAWLFPLLGIAHTELKQYAVAESDFSEALAGSSDPILRALVLTNRCVLRQRQRRLDDAERDLRQAIDLQPKVYQGYLNLADLLKRKNDSVGALKLLDQALAINPNDPTLYFERARLHAEKGDRTAAALDFEQVIAKEKPDSKSDRVLRARVELAHLRCLAGEHQAALADCDAILAANGNFPEAHRQRAEVLLALGGRHKEAAAELQQYLKVGGKETAAVHKARGLLFAQKGDYRSAVAAYSQALVLEPDAKTLSYRGWAYLKQEAVTPALDDFDAALKSNPKEADALTGRGTALVLRGRAADIAPAVAAAEKALRAEPRTFTRLMACARIYSRAAELQKAQNPRFANDPQTARYAERALRLLREAEELLPQKERQTFWRDHVRSDPGLLQLVRSFGG